ncbi:MAG: PAS domain-containing sensor histidine kinase [Rhodospirillales bacterium]|nr:PAS domain-containing sensor histidine kinase [Rhodospirillales bacterium]MBO6786833.1 PAS domain-containing sensor histidine kinase [Rhodospirillales bacterium]
MTAKPAANFRERLSNSSLQRRFASLLAIAAVVSGVATVSLMTDTTAVRERVEELRWLLAIDSILLLALCIVVARRVITLWLARTSGRAGAGLQGRLVMLFAMIAVTPALLVAVFSYLSLNFGLEAWFNDRVSGALRESAGVTEAYLKEHRQNIANQAYSVAYVLNLNAPTLIANPWEFNRILTANATLRELPEAVVIDSLGNTLARSEFALSTVIEEIPPTAFEQADKGEVTLLGSENEDKVRALVKLNRFVNAYLLVERFVDPRVLQHITGIRKAFDEYNQLEATRSGVQISFVLIYAIAVLILILAAIWIGMTVSAQLAEPVTRLIDATDKVSKGDLSVRVDAKEAKDEIATLGHAFNNMTERIYSQQQGLIAANVELDERRHFTETVLAGVSAGVVGLDAEARINLPNRSASNLLGMNLQDHIGEKLVDVVPELEVMVEQSKARPDRLQQAEITVHRKDGQKTFLVRVAAEHLDNSIVGFVVTFDDVTELLSAQRKAAWADVARRIAHEIKNPLTPIQLSAERLNRKYLKEISSDKETFDKLTETIIRQVGDIGRMVDEFSSFARMPQPSIKMENLSELCRQAVFLERNRDGDIDYELILPDDDVIVPCDARQVSRVLTNVLKNGAESIDGAREAGDEGVDGKVTLRIDADDTDRSAIIVVSDDGRGLPEEDQDRLTEPYVTTREKGTGLGLAIVKKIMEEHGGSLTLTNRSPRGANVTLRFPRMEAEGIADSDDVDAVSSASAT